MESSLEKEEANLEREKNYKITATFKNQSSLEELEVVGPEEEKLNFKRGAAAQKSQLGRKIQINPTLEGQATPATPASLETSKSNLRKSKGAAILEVVEILTNFEDQETPQKSKVATTFESRGNRSNPQKPGHETPKKSKLPSSERRELKKNYKLNTLERKDTPKNQSLKVATLELKDPPQKPKVAVLEKKASFRERSKNKVFTLILKSAITEQPSLSPFFPAPGNLELKVTILAAQLFDEILLKEKIDLLASLNLQDNQENVKSASQAEGGRGGQLFLFSFDNQLIVKSMSEEDWKALKGVHKKYCEYVGRREESLITRIYGAFVFNFYDRSRQRSPIFSQKVIVMRNLAACPRQYISQIYDLKGSTYQRESIGKKKGIV